MHGGIGGGYYGDVRQGAKLRLCIQWYVVQLSVSEVMYLFLRTALLKVSLMHLTAYKN